MEEWVMCKSCLYVMKKSGLKDKCPACGVPDKMFVPYTHRISPARRRLLALDLHPVMVHFTQAFATTIPVLCIIALLGGAGFNESITATIAVMGMALPAIVVLTFIAGVLDGKIRFRRLVTPLLRTKMILSTALLALSCGIPAVLLLHRSLDPAGLVIILVLGAAGFVCASILGIIGVRLVNSAFPN